LLLKKSPLTPLCKRGETLAKTRSGEVAQGRAGQPLGKDYADAQFVSLKNYQHLPDEKRLDNNSRKSGKKKNQIWRHGDILSYFPYNFYASDAANIRYYAIDTSKTRDYVIAFVSFLIAACVC
jgi:hypothetical protein